MTKALPHIDAVGPPGAKAAPEEGAGDGELSDVALVAALRARDESAFANLVRRYQRAMLAVANRYVSDPATAEDVVQETWLAVIGALDRFEARSSLKTWIFAILAKRAHTTSRRQRRSVPVDWTGGDPGDPAVSRSYFRGPDDVWPGRWVTPPRPWTTGESAVEASELRSVVRDAIATLPPAQQTVISLRDVVGRSADEVGDLLGLSPGNLRVLLHRARSKVRAAIDHYFEQDTSHQGP